MRLPVLLLILVAACRPSGRDGSAAAATADAIDPATGVPADCGFVKAFAHPNGRALLNDFLASDAEGQFLQSDEWFSGAVDCPDHEPGPDGYTLIERYTPAVDQLADTLMQAIVTSRRLGYVGSDGNSRPTFALDTGTTIDTVTVRRTTYGWRVVSPALRQLVLYADTGTRRRLGPIADSVAAVLRPLLSR